MKHFLFIISILSCLILFGCGYHSADHSSQQNIEVRNISANKVIDQAPSNEAKELLINHDEIIGVKAANTSKDLIVAVKIKHRERFQLKQLKEEFTQELKDHFKNFHIELTIDKKIFLELDKLEEEIQSRSISPGKLGKEIERIIKLSKEKT